LKGNVFLPLTFLLLFPQPDDPEKQISKAENLFILYFFRYFIIFTLEIPKMTAYIKLDLKDL